MMESMTANRRKAAALTTIAFALLLVASCAKGPSDAEVIAVTQERRFGYSAFPEFAPLHLDTRVLKRGKPHKVGGEWVFPSTVEHHFIGCGLNYSGYCDDTEYRDVVEYLLAKDNFGTWSVSDSRSISQQMVGKYSRPGNIPMSQFYRDKLSGQPGSQASGTPQAGAPPIDGKRFADQMESRFQKLEKRVSAAQYENPGAPAEQWLKISQEIARGRQIMAGMPGLTERTDLEPKRDSVQKAYLAARKVLKAITGKEDK